MSTDLMQGTLDERRNFDRHGDERPEKVTRTYEIIYRDSTVVWEGYLYEATSFRRAVRKARKWAWKEGHTSWSVYAVEVAGHPETRKYGPFRYNKKWGEK